MIYPKDGWAIEGVLMTVRVKAIVLLLMVRVMHQRRTGISDGVRGDHCLHRFWYTG